MTNSFALSSRLLHWIMAALILAMLFIGIGMVSSLSNYHCLVSIHEPLGLVILCLAAVRLVNRFIHPPPHLPAEMPDFLRFAAHASHWMLYGLMFALPLVGWAMLSASATPATQIASLHLPAIVPHSDQIYAWLRPLHTVLAFLLFATFLVHLGAALTHALIFRDGVFQSMAAQTHKKSTKTLQDRKSAPNRDPTG